MSDAMQNAELFSEGWLFAALLELVVTHCSAGGDGRVRSFNRRADARAIWLLAEADYVEIIKSCGDEVEALVSNSGQDLLARAQRSDPCGSNQIGAV